MKEKIFLLSKRILDWFSVSSIAQTKISNWANLLFLTFKDGSKYAIRNEDLYNISRDFIKNSLFQDKKSEKIIKLKKNLDMESQGLVDEILRRHEYIYTHSLLDSRVIFNSEELKKQKIVNSFRKTKNDYIQICNYPETFFYHNGLKILPDDVLAKTSGKDVIDGGAFVGDSAIIFNKEYSFRNIYSFEPDRLNYIKLKENIAKYKMGNVIPVKKGIFSKEGKVSFNVRGVTSLINSRGGEEITVVSIDKFIESHNTEINIGVIKFDIEGTEFEGIAGSLKTIKKFKPVLLISIYHTSKDFFEIKPLLESLDLGYKFVIRKINPGDPVIETILIAYVVT